MEPRARFTVLTHAVEIMVCVFAVFVMLLLLGVLVVSVFDITRPYRCDECKKERKWPRVLP